MDAVTCPGCKGRGGFDSAEDCHECAWCGGAGRTTIDRVYAEGMNLWKRLNEALRDATAARSLPKQTPDDLGVLQPVQFTHGGGLLQTRWQVTLGEDGSLQILSHGRRNGRLLVEPSSHTTIRVTSSRIESEKGGT